MHGAKVLQVRQLRRRPRPSFASSADNEPVTVVTSINPYRIEGQKTGAFEIVDVLGDAPDLHGIPVGNAGNITAYWRATTSTSSGARPPSSPACRLPGRRAAPIVDGHPIEHPETVATAIRIGNPASWYGATAAASEIGGAHRSGHRRRDPRRLPFPRPPRSRCSASRRRRPRWPDCSRWGCPAGSTVVCVLTGHGLEGPRLRHSQIVGAHRRSRPTTGGAGRPGPVGRALAARLGEPATAPGSACAHGREQTAGDGCRRRGAPGVRDHQTPPPPSIRWSVAGDRLSQSVLLSVFRWRPNGGQRPTCRASRRAPYPLFRVP